MVCWGLLILVYWSHSLTHFPSFTFFVSAYIYLLPHLKCLCVCVFNGLIFISKTWYFCLHMCTVNIEVIKPRMWVSERERECKSGNGCVENICFHRRVKVVIIFITFFLFFCFFEKVLWNNDFLNFYVLAWTAIFNCVNNPHVLINNNVIINFFF